MEFTYICVAYKIYIRTKKYYNDYVQYFSTKNILSIA